MSAAFADMTFPVHRRKIGPSERTEIRQRYRAGHRLTDIAKDYGVGTSAISYHVRDIKDRGGPDGGKALAPCGTKSAYERHLRRGEPTDEACRLAVNAAQRAYTAARRGETTTCAARDCTRTPASQYDSGYCADCHDAHRDDQESPRELTGGRWVTGKGGIRTWKKD